MQGVAWPALAPTVVPPAVALKELLQKIRELKADWNGQGAVAPVRAAIEAAEFVLGQLPDVPMNARAGVDPEGHVFLRLNRGNQLAYLTVEPRVMHLLVTEPGLPNVYIDDAGFNGKIIPEKIRKVLNERLKS